MRKCRNKKPDSIYRCIHGLLYYIYIYQIDLTPWNTLYIEQIHNIQILLLVYACTYLKYDKLCPIYIMWKLETNHSGDSSAVEFLLCGLPLVDPRFQIARSPWLQFTYFLFLLFLFFVVRFNAAGFSLLIRLLIGISHRIGQWWCCWRCCIGRCCSIDWRQIRIKWCQFLTDVIRVRLKFNIYWSKPISSSSKTQIQ